MNATPENIALAARILREGGLAVLPTETVYGLAASIASDEALRRIFEVKRRPQENPLIVHIFSPSQLGLVASEVRPQALQLSEKFWPGPLTLVLPKLPSVSPLVTAGGATVAVRMPSHPVMLEVLRQTGVPLAAPSANPFMGLSPTRAEHVDASIVAEVGILLDGGPCAVGIESTVVDCTEDGVRILRPGGITRAQIAEVVPVLDGESGERKSPGMYLRHYSPKTPLKIVEKLGALDAGICFGLAQSDRQVGLPLEPVGYAAGLYAALHFLDGLGVGELLVERPPETGEWVAVWDRLGKAAWPSELS